MKQIIIAIALCLSLFQVIGQNDIKPPKIEASYPGGNNAMIAYINTNVKYPKSNKIEGKVYVEFIIEADGKVSNAKILKGIDATLDKIALDAILKMPHWVPAKDDKGLDVKSKMVLPINFKKG